MTVGRRVHLRLCAAAMLLSLPVAASSTNAVGGTLPTATARSSTPQSAAPAGSVFGSNVATQAADVAAGSVFGSYVATQAADVTVADATAVARRVRATVRHELKVASPTPVSALQGVSPDDLDIPDTALIAYQVAATTMAQVDPSCGVDWSLLAAIGRVESDHGRYAGARLGRNGLSRPLIRGVALDGKGPVSAVPDTDGGRLDGDKVWDRAVGPMQFLPSTWGYAGVDADGDGVRSPDDINDAALAAAVYLCAAPGDVDNPAGLRTAVHRYNPSRAYVDLVVALTQGYRHGDLIHPTTSSTTTAEALGAVGTGPAGEGGQGPSGDDVRPSGDTGDNGGDPGDGPGDGPGADEGDGGGTGSASLHDPIQTLPGSDDVEPMPGPEPTKQPQPTDHPEPTDGPDPTDHPDPTDGPDPDPDPTDHPDPGPSENPEPTPPPEPEPVLVELTGVLTLLEDVATEDGTTVDLWYLSGAVADGTELGDLSLYVGDESWLAEPAANDLDADGVVETSLEELKGLVGTEVVLHVEEDTDPAVVHLVNDLGHLGG